MFGARKTIKPVVVSYASGDRGAALAIVRDLESADIAVWVAPRDVDPAQGSADQIAAAIRRSAAVLLIVSRAANQSRVLKTEGEIAIGIAPILPVRIEDERPAQALRTLVQGQPIFDLFGDARDAGLDRLIEAIRPLQGQPRRKRAAPAEAGTATAPNTGAPPLGDNAALRAFIGPRANPILERWRELDGRDRRHSPFAAGLLFGRYWLIYRKLWRLALPCSLIALALVAVALEGLVRGTLAGGVIAALGFVALAVPVWRYGLASYQARARKAVGRWNIPALDDVTATRMLDRRGGTSLLAIMALAVFEIGAGIGLVFALDPDLLTALTNPLPPPPDGKLALVDMTRPIDEKARYNFCISNPTDTRVNLALRYGGGPIEHRAIEARSKVYTFWSKQSERPTVSFDHVLGDGGAYTDRTYGLETARTHNQTSCGGISYYFVATGTDLDLKLREIVP